MNDIEKLYDIYNKILTGDITPEEGMSNIVDIIIKNNPDNIPPSKQEIEILSPIFYNPEMEKIEGLTDPTQIGWMVLRRLFKVDNIRVDTNSDSLSNWKKLSSSSENYIFNL